jgi:hypothetical protein
MCGLYNRLQIEKEKCDAEYALEKIKFNSIINKQNISIEQFYPKSIFFYIVFCFVTAISVFLIAVILYHLLKKIINKLSGVLLHLI